MRALRLVPAAQDALRHRARAQVRENELVIRPRVDAWRAQRGQPAVMSTSRTLDGPVMLTGRDGVPDKYPALAGAPGHSPWTPRPLAAVLDDNLATVFAVLVVVAVAVWFALPWLSEVWR